MTVKMGGNYPPPGEKMDFNESDCKGNVIPNDTRGEAVILQRETFVEIKYLLILLKKSIF